LNSKILTIDGASGVGKGTIAKIIAQQKGWKLLDSGSIYRSFAYAVRNKKNPNETFLLHAVRNLDLVFQGDEIVLDGVDISAHIRTEEIGTLASKLAKLDFIRTALLQKQRDFATDTGLVADGRDMATVVFPQAKYQVFLTASVEERTQRRAKQLQVAGNSSKIDEIRQSIIQRDERDTSRTTSPLMPSENAFIIDTSNLSIDEVVTKIVNYMQK
jgi:cytidylate kinase